MILHNDHHYSVHKQNNMNMRSSGPLSCRRVHNCLHLCQWPSHHIIQWHICREKPGYFYQSIHCKQYILPLTFSRIASSWPLLKIANHNNGSLPLQWKMSSCSLSRQIITRTCWDDHSPKTIDSNPLERSNIHKPTVSSRHTKNKSA